MTPVAVGNPGAICRWTKNQESNTSMKHINSFTMSRVMWLVPLAVLATCASLLAQPYGMPCYSVAGGGGTSTGAVYSVRATIGQHSVGTMSGGQISLRGGFWALALVQTPGAPRLTIQPAGPGQATLSWSPETPGFVLQSSDSLSPPAWTDAPSGTNHPVTVPTAGSRKFYRLARP
jgi:hypothetical protein